MDVIRKSALGVSASLLFIMLFVFGLAFGLYRLFGEPDTLKAALKESGIYQTAVGDALEQAQSEQRPGDEEEIPVDNPEVQKLIKSAASPEVLQSQTEQALDAFYAWMKGDTPKLQFAVDLGNIKQNLAAGVSEYVQERAASLPACTPDAAPSGGDFDPFNATCVPPGTSPSQLAAEAQNQMLGGEFLKDTTISADSLKSKDGKTIEESLSVVPTAYRGITWAVYGTGLLAALLATLMVFLSTNRRSGIKKVSVIFVVVGSISAFVSWLASYGVERAKELATEPLQQSGVKVAQVLAGDLREWWMWYGIGLAVAGAVTLVVLHFTKPSSSEVAEKLAAAGEESTAETGPEEPKPADRPKPPKPVKKLVQ